jgi:hypothetical protein
MKMDISMGIHKDKSMDFSLIEAFDTQVLAQLEAAGYETETTELTDDEIKQTEEETGFTIEKYKDGTLEGYKYTKTYPNIDQISNEMELEYDLGTVTSDDSDTQQFFQVEKGLFKNVYKAKFINSSVDQVQDQMDSSDTQVSEVDMSSLTSQMSFDFTVQLPYKAISSNAASISDDGKTLTWDLLNAYTNTIEFEFALYNTKNIYIALGITISFIIILMVLVLITLRGNKKRDLKKIIERENQEETSISEMPLGMEQPIQPMMTTTSPVELVPDNFNTSVDSNSFDNQ